MSDGIVVPARARVNRRPSLTLHRRRYEQEKVYHKPIQPFFELMNNYPLKATESVWLLTPLIQIVGLVNERAAKLARAFYGSCWAIVYSCFRPWAANREGLSKKKGRVPQHVKTFYDVNEHFRLGMGTLVSAVYGGGAFGMLWGWFKNDDDLFDKADDICQTGMLNQNQIFASMNLSEVLKRQYTPEKMGKYDRNKKAPTSIIEMTDSILFAPTIITRALDTFKMFGMELGETTQRIINAFSYFSYGTWAARFGIVKQTEDKKAKRGSGLLDPINPKLKGRAKRVEEALYISQKYGGRIFSTLLPGLSWLSSGAELFGFGEFAKNTFKLEGILERLNPAIASWCGRSTWLRLYEQDAKSPEMTMAA